MEVLRLRSLRSLRSDDEALWKASKKSAGAFEEGLAGGFNADSADAVAVHFEDGEAAAFVLERFAALGDVAEAGKDESGESFDAALAGQAPAHLGFEVAQVDAAVEHEAAGGGGEDFFGG